MPMPKQKRPNRDDLLDELGGLLTQCEHYRRRSRELDPQWKRIYEIYHLLTGKGLMSYT